MSLDLVDMVYDPRKRLACIGKWEEIVQKSIVMARPRGVLKSLQDEASRTGF